MKKINRKGFTLIELLAVVVILLAISVMAISSISAAIERNKKKQNDAKIDVILSYAELYFDTNKNRLVSTAIDKKGQISLDLLDLSDSEKVNADDELFSGVVCFEYTDSRASDVTFRYDDKKDSSGIFCTE